VVLIENGAEVTTPLVVEAIVPPLAWAMITLQVRAWREDAEWLEPTSWPLSLLPEILDLARMVSGSRDFSGTFGEGSVQESALPGVHEIVEQAINDREMGTYQRRQGEYLIYPRTEEWVLSEYEWAVRENLFLRQSEIHLRRVLRRYFGETNESLTRRVAEILGDV
jgi:hypothetical protein